MQSNQANGRHISWQNKVVPLHPSCSLPKLQSVIIHCHGSSLDVRAYGFRPIFDAIQAPLLSQVDIDLSRSPKKHLNQLYSSPYRSNELVNALHRVRGTLQHLSITIGHDRTKFIMTTLRSFEPFDPRYNTLLRLRRLRNLCVPSAALVSPAVRTTVFGLSHIPTTLEHLTSPIPMRTHYTGFRLHSRTGSPVTPICKASHCHVRGSGESRHRGSNAVEKPWMACLCVSL